MAPNVKYDNTYEGVENMCATLFGWRGETTKDSEFLCYCPVHGDSQPSLHVTLDESNGAILMRCMSHECDVYKYVSDRRGWPQQAKSQDEAKIKNAAYVKRNPNIGGTKFKWTSVPASHNKAKAYLSSRNESYSYTEEATGKKVTMVKTMGHIYTDGEMVHSIVIRYDDMASVLPKQIRQHSFGYFEPHPDLPSGAPINANNPKFYTKAWRNDKIMHMPYAVTYLRSRPSATVVIVEGEKAADYGNIHLAQSYSDYVFTTWKGGSSAVRFTDWDEISGRNVIIIPDHDEAGRSAAKELHDHLVVEGLPNDIWIADTTQFDLPKKWDIADLKNIGTQTSWPTFPQLVSRNIGVHDFDHLNMHVPDHDYGDGEGYLGGDPHEGRYCGHEGGIVETRASSAFSPISRRIIFHYSPDGSHLAAMRAHFSNYGTIATGNEVTIFNKAAALAGRGQDAICSIKKFHQITSNVLIQLSEKSRKLTAASAAWLLSDHTSYEDYVSTPLKPVEFNRNNENIANIWPGIEAARATEIGDDTAFYEHLKFICSGENPETQDKLLYFLMCVMAHMVQRPGVRTGKIIFFCGLQGSGKSTVHEFLIKMFGPKTSYVAMNTSQITGKFNEAIAGKLLVAVDEARLTGKNGYGVGEDYDAIKHLVTSSTTTTEKKFGSQVSIDLFFTLFCCTNHMNFADISDAERRICPIQVPDDFTKMGARYNESGPYFDKIYNSIQNGGPAAFYKRLMEFPLPDKLPPYPATKAMRMQVMHSKENKKESLFNDWLSKCIRNRQIIGEEGGRAIAWVAGERIPRSVFKDHFEKWQADRINAKRFTLKSSEFFNAFNEFSYGAVKNNPDILKTTIIKGGFRCIVSVGTTVVVLPEIKDIQKLFEDRMMNNPNYDVGGYIDGECQDDMEITKH